MMEQCVLEEALLYNSCMNHHRRGLTALIFLLLLTGIYAYESLKPESPPPLVVPPLPFDGAIPAPITHGDQTKKQIIFTFDAGEGDASLSSILVTLTKHHVKGTFFVTGQWALRHAPQMRRIVAAGHEVFNHTFSHPDLTWADDQSIRHQLVAADEVIVEFTGTTSQPFFRPPYGYQDERVITIAARKGFQSVLWTVDALDWMQSQGETKQEVFERIMANVTPGALILMHIGDSITGAILDDVFTAIEKQGYTIVSLSQGL